MVWSLDPTPNSWWAQFVFWHLNSLDMPEPGSLERHDHVQAGGSWALMLKTFLISGQRTGLNVYDLFYGLDVAWQNLVLDKDSAYV